MSYFRCSIVLCVCASLLAGCGGSGSLSPVGSNANTLLRPLERSQTFGFTGAEQRFTVPSGVKRVTIAASGASGFNCVVGSCGYYGQPGNGGWLKATIPVTSGETLYVFVGGYAGYNGGGKCPGSDSCDFRLSGGGASDIRQGGDGITKRVVVAAGGGGGGRYAPDLGEYGGDGGAGGGTSGTLGGNGGSGFGGNGFGGGPGTQHAGGAGGAGPPGLNGGCSGTYGGTGRLGIGGYSAVSCGGPGGGGGGGYYGGGGGGSGGYVSYGYGAGSGGGGGGGSSFAAKRAFDVTEKTGGGAYLANGQIVISW
ncbi:MAG TPA: hypothetical protein VGI19_01510 [Candidatus Cybelea sp.]|jgi:hypothetical protein